MSLEENMPKMRAVQIPRPGGPFELVERDIPEPGPGWVRIKVQACGICHSDSLVKEGHWPGIQYPRVPGHEVAGVIDAVGAGVAEWKAGHRVGVGWYGGHCGYCESCRRGDFITCRQGKICGISYDGGYADYMVAPREALARIPDELPVADAGPLLCAGITTYNALRKSGARAGDLVAVLALAGSDISAFNMPRRWDSTPWPLRGGRTRNNWRASSARAITLTPRRRIPPKNSPSWEARELSSPQ